MGIKKTATILTMTTMLLGFASTHAASCNNFSVSTDNNTIAPFTTTINLDTSIDTLNNPSIEIARKTRTRLGRSGRGRGNRGAQHSYTTVYTETVSPLTCTLQALLGNGPCSIENTYFENNNNTYQPGTYAIILKNNNNTICEKEITIKETAKVQAKNISDTTANHQERVTLNEFAIKVNNQKDIYLDSIRMSNKGEKDFNPSYFSSFVLEKRNPSNNYRVTVATPSITATSNINENMTDTLCQLLASCETTAQDAILTFGPSVKLTKQHSASAGLIYRIRAQVNQINTQDLKIEAEIVDIEASMTTTVTQDTAAYLYTQDNPISNNNTIASNNTIIVPAKEVTWSDQIDISRIDNLASPHIYQAGAQDATLLKVTIDNVSNYDLTMDSMTITINGEKENITEFIIYEERILQPVSNENTVISVDKVLPANSTTTFTIRGNINNIITNNIFSITAENFNIKTPAGETIDSIYEISTPSSTFKIEGGANQNINISKKASSPAPSYLPNDTENFTVLTSQFYTDTAIKLNKMKIFVDINQDGPIEPFENIKIFIDSGYPIAEASLSDNNIICSNEIDECYVEGEVFEIIPAGIHQITLQVDSSIDAQNFDDIVVSIKPTSFVFDNDPSNITTTNNQPIALASIQGQATGGPFTIKRPGIESITRTDPFGQGTGVALTAGTTNQTIMSFAIMANEAGKDIVINSFVVEGDIKNKLTSMNIYVNGNIVESESIFGNQITFSSLDITIPSNEIANIDIKANINDVIEQSPIVEFEVNEFNAEDEDGNMINTDYYSLTSASFIILPE